MLRISVRITDGPNRVRVANARVQAALRGSCRLAGFPNERSEREPQPKRRPTRTPSDHCDQVTKYTGRERVVRRTSINRTNESQPPTGAPTVSGPTDHPATHPPGAEPLLRLPPRDISKRVFALLKGETPRPPGDRPPPFRPPAVPNSVRVCAAPRPASPIKGRGRGG